MCIIIGFLLISGLSFFGLREFLSVGHTILISIVLGFVTVCVPHIVFEIRLARDMDMAWFNAIGNRNANISPKKNQTA